MTHVWMLYNVRCCTQRDYEIWVFLFCLYYKNLFICIKLDREILGPYALTTQLQQLLLKLNLVFSVPHPLVHNMHQIQHQSLPLSSMIPLVAQDFTVCANGSYCYGDDYCFFWFFHWFYFGLLFCWQSRKNMFCFDFEHQIHYQFILISTIEIKNSEFLVKLFYFYICLSIFPGSEVLCQENQGW